MEYFASQDPRSYSLYFDLNIWFRARKVTGTFEKGAPHLSDPRIKSAGTVCRWISKILKIYKVSVFNPQISGFSLVVPWKPEIKTDPRFKSLFNLFRCILQILSRWVMGSIPLSTPSKCKETGNEFRVRLWAFVWKSFECFHI